MVRVWQFAAGLAPHIGFEYLGFFSLSIGFLKIPMKIKLQSSSLVWVSLLLAASLESTVSNMITAGF